VAGARLVAARIHTDNPGLKDTVRLSGEELA
jgi:hypothetical protein